MGQLEPKALATLENAESASARYVVLDEFLAPEELETITNYTLEHEADFSTSVVVSPEVEGGVLDYDHRRSRVLMEPECREVVLERIKSVLPRMLEKLGMEEFPISQVEAQITASNDGDFFHCHSDDGNERVATRQLTFVYFFHREPRQFEGGELRIYDRRGGEEQSAGVGSYHAIVPQQNQIVLFPCSLMHEITAVECPSQAFADSRFTLNGWLHR